MTMTASTTRTPKRLRCAAALLGAVAFFAMAPTTAHAAPGPGGGCSHADRDGFDVPVDDGQSVVVDGKTVTCHGGQATESPAPKRNVGSASSPS
jgi:Spy/CpxP family protein refolding chaperone